MKFIFTLTLGFLLSVSVFSQSVVITESDVVRKTEGTPPLPSESWVLYTRAATPGIGNFITGPGTPPSGIGSFEMQTVIGSDKVFLYNFDHVGTPLSSINAISYSTFRTAGVESQVASINIQVDINGGTLQTGDFTTLVFEPVYNTGQGSVVNGQWQSWNAFNEGNGIWWSTRPIPGVCAFDCFVTWNTIISGNPNATIVGAFGVNQGSGNGGLQSAVDALTLGYTVDSQVDTITYDFEPYRIATSRDQCKVGGWQSYRRADGTEFRNQGDCVSYVNTGN